jgi:hypothetical protein
MGRSYSQYPFHQQQPMLGVQGSGARLGNDEDKQVPVKSEVPDPHTEETRKDAGGIHYGMKHAETVKRLQARRAKRAQQESQGRGKAAAKRPTGKSAEGTGTAKKAEGTGTAKKAEGTTGTAKKATGTGTAAKKAAGTGTAKKAAKKSTPAEAAAPAATAKAPRGGTLSRLVGAVMKGTKGVVREGALAKAVRLGKTAATKVVKKPAKKK